MLEAWMSLGGECFTYSDGQIEVLAKCDHPDYVKHNNSNRYILTFCQSKIALMSL